MQHQQLTLRGEKHYFSHYIIELSHYSIRNVQFDTHTKILGMQRNKKIWLVHRHKAISRNYP